MTLSIEQCFGGLALVTSCVGLLPQVYRAYRTKSTRDISMLMLLNYALGSLAWLGYGLLNGAGFVSVANTACLTASLISMGQKIYYDKKYFISDLEVAV
jgi:MtN3 and saliva related transmembrane protein